MLRLRQLWRNEKKLSHYINELNAKKVLLPFGHGMGDLLMAFEPYKKLQETFPDVDFTLALQDGLGFQELEQDIPGKAIYVRDLSYNNDNYEYDIIADIDFPMNEGQIKWTKGQFCCINELGIEPNENIYPKLVSKKNRLVLIQFHITCLPDCCNPDYETAKRIWNDVLESGYIPMEMHFEHVFHNPVNKKFDFIECSVRKVRPRISTLVGLIEQAAGIISVVTGNLHIALANKEPERILFLEKDFKLESFVKNDKIQRVNLREYKGEVKQWLQNIENIG